MPKLLRHGNKWRFQYRDKTVPKGRDNRRWYTIQDHEYDGTRQDAERAMRAFLGRPVNERTIPSRAIFLPFAHEVIDSLQMADKTRRTWHADIDHHCRLLHHKRVVDITPDDLVAVIQDIRTKPKPPGASRPNKPYSENTIKNVFVPLNKIFKRAERRKMIARNPIELLESGERFKPTPTEQRILTVDELPRLLDAAVDYHRQGHVKYAAIIGLALFAGLRKSEILRLLWDDIDFDQGWIYVRKENRILGTGKTASAVRRVELPRILYDILWKHRLEMETTSDFVFHTSSGKPMSSRNVGRYVDDIVMRSGLWTGPDDRRPKPTLHPLRHNYFSSLISEGVDIKYTSMQGGHANAGFTLERYTHLVEERKSRGQAAQAIDRYWLGDENGGQTSGNKQKTPGNSVGGTSDETGCFPC